MIMDKRMTDIKNKIIRESVYNELTKTVIINRYFRDRHIYSKINEIIINNVDDKEAENIAKSNNITYVFSAMNKHNIYSIEFEYPYLFNKQNASKLINLRRIVTASNNKIYRYTVNAKIYQENNTVKIMYNGEIQVKRISDIAIIKFNNVTEGYTKRLFTSIVTAVQNNVNVIEVEVNKRVSIEYIKDMISMIMFKCKCKFDSEIHIQRYYDTNILDYKLSYSYYRYINNDIYLITSSKYKKYMNIVAVHNIDNYDTTIELVKTVETVRKGLKTISIKKAISGQYIILITNIGYIVYKNIDKAVKTIEINNDSDNTDTITIRYSDNTTEKIKKEEVVDNILNNELLNINDISLEVFMIR